MFIIHRYTSESDSNIAISPEFQAIRQAYWNIAVNEDISLGNWLRKLGVETVTNIPESDSIVDYDNWLEEYMVLEVHFPSEHAYLVFKLKHL
jgi:hypothetical protein